MFLKYQFVVLSCVSLFLTGCSMSFFRMSKEPVVFGFQRVIIDVKYEINCNWKHRSSPELVHKAPEFGCHLGTQDAVSLFVRADNENHKRLDSMQLIWKEWSLNVYKNTGDKEAFSTLAYLTKRFLHRVDEVKLVKHVIDAQPITIKGEYIDAVYTVEQMPNLRTHIITFKNKLPYQPPKVKEKLLEASPSEKTPEEILDELIAEDAFKAETTNEVAE